MQQDQQQINAARNAQHALEAESSVRILTDLIVSRVGKLVLTTDELAGMLGKSTQGLRLAEARHRSRFGTDLLPRPLLKNVAGRIWTAVQIAEWMAAAPGSHQQPASDANQAPQRRGRGRPRKAA